MLHARVVRVSENVADGCSVRSETADTRNAAIRRGSGEDKRKATIEIASACWHVTALRDGITREHLTTGGVNKPDSRRIYDVVGISLRTGRRGDLRQTAPASIRAGRRQAGGRKRRGKGSVRESSGVVDIAKVRRSRAVVCREFCNERLCESVGIQPRPTWRSTYIHILDATHDDTLAVRDEASGTRHRAHGVSGDHFPVGYKSVGAIQAGEAVLATGGRWLNTGAGTTAGSAPKSHSYGKGDEEAFHRTPRSASFWACDKTEAGVIKKPVVFRTATACAPFCTMRAAKYVLSPRASG